jgi:uncharacterized surface protein with fasciclin (FAS1) repeats
MKLTHIAVIAALAVASLGVVACGSSDTETTASTTTTTATTADETIAAIATGNPDLSTLVAALTAAGDGALRDLGEPGPYTVFAPTDAAFADIQSTVDTLLEPGNKTDLQQVLGYHVVPGTYTAADLTDGQKLKTVEGQDLTVSITDGVVKVNDATVEATDITASNGVVHVINKVLVPPAS